MTFGKRMKTALLGAVLALLLGSLVPILLAPSVRPIVLISLIASGVVFILAFIFCFILEGKPSKLRIPIFTFLVVVALCVVTSITVYNIGKRIAFPGSFDEDAYEDLQDLDDGSVELISAGELSGWRIPSVSAEQDAPRPVILYFGGNGEDSSSKVWNLIKNDKLSFLIDTCDFVYIDYPTYGVNGGTVDVNSIKQFATEAYEAVISLPTTSEVILLSYSIGNGPASYLASMEETEISSMIMLAPYNSGYDLFNAHLNIFHGPLKLLCFYNMPCYRFARTIDCPVTVIASDADNVIPISSSRSFFAELSSSSANFITVNGVDHNDFFTDRVVIDAVAGALEGI